MGYFKMRNLSPSVSVSIADWMRKHGYAVRPELSKQERAQLQECFALMDGDGSGSIDVEELHSAFKILGLHVTKHAVAELLAKVDADGSGVQRRCTNNETAHAIVGSFPSACRSCSDSSARHRRVIDGTVLSQAKWSFRSSFKS